MAKCSECGCQVSMPYDCNRCGNQYCSDHRLPEKHTCVIVKNENQSDSINNVKSTIRKPLSNKIPNFNIFWNKLNGKVNYLFGATILSVYVIQYITLILFGMDLHNTLFVLESENIEYVWTWFTSIFAHSPVSFYHIFANGIVLIFFGTLLENIIGSKKYFYLFIASGVLAGLSQVLVGVFLGSTVGVLGASGALLAVMGVLTIYKPKMRVYLFFIIPAPLWSITVGFAGFTIVAIVAFGSLAGGIAHFAHLTGLVIGLVYGYKTKDSVQISQNSRLKTNFRR